MPKYFADASLFRGDTGLGANVIRDIQVGPGASTWPSCVTKHRAPTARPATSSRSTPPCANLHRGVKATYLRIGKPRSLRAAGTIFFGTRTAWAPPADPAPAPTPMWITMEGWDGRCTRPRSRWPRHRRPPWPGSRNKEANHAPLMRRLALPFLLLAATPALAHNPMCECESRGQICSGGFRRQRRARGDPGRDRLRRTGAGGQQAGDDSTLTFKRPDGEFYVLFDAGPGHVVEVDHADIVRHEPRPGGTPGRCRARNPLRAAGRLLILLLAAAWWRCTVSARTNRPWPATSSTPGVT
jgi:hypothetical protein